VVAGVFALTGSVSGRSVSLWEPFLEWSLENPSYAGNPFDLIASATFIHPESGETRTTEMFYAGGNAWKFRFTGTRLGRWQFSTRSRDPELNGHTGTITVVSNPNPHLAGFVVSIGNKWGKMGTGEAFVPQLVMYGLPDRYHNKPEKIDADIQTFIVGHGFNGFHAEVFCHWFDLEHSRCSDVHSSDPNPDPRTFEALELLITKTHAAGGIVHLWAWGDDMRSMNPKRWGINGRQDKRLQRYIGARLGPLPGWTMGYGFDLPEWVLGGQVAEWHRYMQARLGWPHPLGARAHTNTLRQLSETLDYSSYEQHKPDYAEYVRTIEARPEKPSFSEDRFRVRNEGRPKDYTFDETRRGLWRSTFAGGVANIWGYLTREDAFREGSTPYPNATEIKTYAQFFGQRFVKDLVRCNQLTDGVCLKRPTNAHYLFYKEDSAAIAMDLSGMAGSQPMVAVDSKQPFRAIDLGAVNPGRQSWAAPYVSDWAIAVGDY
jgi:hypothetical protein